jgi:transcriptional regulator with XRE-family HTH domain
MEERTLGMLLTAVRTKKKLSPSEAAELLGLEVGKLTSLEADAETPTEEEAAKLTEHYGIDPAIIKWFALREDAVADDRKRAFTDLKPAVDGLIMRLFS